jgi:hypothetical protein
MQKFKERLVAKKGNTTKTGKRFLPNWIQVRWRYIYIYIYIRVDHMNGSIFAVHQHRQILCDVVTYCRLSLFLVVVVVVFSQTITNNKKNLTYLKILHQLGKHHRIHSEFSKRFSFSKILLKLFWCCIFYVCQINNNDPQPIVERWKKKRRKDDDDRRLSVWLLLL